ncbi:PREDICTED: B-cell linker protein-like isoform X2 [Priapulus caudatus]|uniref:B-cell linker protein-like isoform X2 n=1 Tax=Priapulus caudatus TaxID=37621 RepID=A0ABM1ELS4_PRICU|nr:PREDICTED: B-cell linker protein-like isoform X2 [Priapulus caudatus]
MSRVFLPAVGEIEGWSEADVVAWLRQNDCECCIGAFQKRQITGPKLLELEEGVLLMWRELPIRFRRLIADCLKKTKSSTGKMKFPVKLPVQKTPPPPVTKDYHHDDCDGNSSDGWDSEFDDLDDDGDGEEYENPDELQIQKNANFGNTSHSSSMETSPRGMPHNEPTTPLVYELPDLPPLIDRCAKPQRPPNVFASGDQKHRPWDKPPLPTTPKPSLSKGWVSITSPSSTLKVGNLTGGYSQTSPASSSAPSSVEVTPENQRRRDGKRGLPSIPVCGVNTDVSGGRGSAKRVLPPIPVSPNNRKVGSELSNQSWYHGNIGRDQAGDMLLKIETDGTFLVRDSKRGKCPYTLDVLFERKTWHLQIRQRRDGLYALGSEKDNETKFASIQEMIAHHKINCISLARGGKVILDKEP